MQGICESRIAAPKEDIQLHKVQNSVSSISKDTTNEDLLPKDDTLPIDASKESQKDVKQEVKEEVDFIEDDVLMLLEAKNGDASLISKAMAEEEEKLQEARVKEESEINKRDEAEATAASMNETQFSKLDELLTQTQLYSEFLLEKMEDITFVNSYDHTPFPLLYVIFFSLDFYVTLPCRTGWKVNRRL